MRERMPARLVTIALVSSLMIAGLSLTAASWTGAAVMMALSVGALVGAAHQALLLQGLRDLNASPEHETFRSYVVAILLYALGSGVALAQGTATLTSTHTVVSPLLDVLALSLALGIAGATLLVTLAIAQSHDGSDGPLKRPKAPPLRVLYIAHAGTIASLLIAALGVAFLALLELPVADGAATISLGLVMALIATAMSLEVKKALGQSRPTAATPAQPALHMPATAADTVLKVSEQPAARPPLAEAIANRSNDAHLSRKEKKRLKRQQP